jgi:hypothetical protein
MDLADVLRQFETADEDLKVIQLLGMRTFNAFGASVKLALSGYSQNSALILRDVLETVFLIGYFAGDRTLIERWRFADKRARLRDFGPLKVRGPSTPATASPTRSALRCTKCSPSSPAIPP